ncbi:hypothetical protein [Variovorax guangxiensis]|uniref:hypothetical protein n=1 Tax=Variovorax guangxiensis TaxID=1775474 RepID=UPI00285C1DBB|nr:hypothetical protein [Variovorax guangxiensis]MDR6860491.1 hypothetical protein [Variovorax guangxiensis]
MRRAPAEQPAEGTARCGGTRKQRPSSAAGPVREQRVNPPAGSNISCVIPCFNEGANLNVLLSSLEEIRWSTHLHW